MCVPPLLLQILSSRETAHMHGDSVRLSVTRAFDSGAWSASTSGQRQPRLHTDRADRRSASMRLAVLALSFTAAVGHATTQYRPRHFASAAAYGAIPDDGKDDTLALRRALADCRRSGGAVYIPPGQYIVSHLTTAQGGPLPVATIDILPVPADCHVFGGGREGASRTTVALATTGGADGRGVNGVDGCWWRMFGWCGNVSAGLCTSPPANVTITDLHLTGSTNYTNYTQIAGQREHGSLIFFYQSNPVLLPIVGVTIERIFAEAVAGDCIDLGDGVQDVLVSDIHQRDYLRVGVDQAGAGPVARNREIRLVVDLPSSPGVQAGNSIHIEEAENLTNVWIHHNIANHSMALSGCKNLTVEDNVVEGAIVANGDIGVIVRNNTILATDENCGAMISLLSARNARIVGNAVTVAGATCSPIGVNIWGNDEGFPFSQDVLIAFNSFHGRFDPLFRGKPYHGGITVDGVIGMVIEGNTWTERPKTQDNVCECCRYGQKTQCQNITMKTDDD
jgi:hypothetical protein